MQAARRLSVVSATSCARRRPIRDVRRFYTHTDMSEFSESYHLRSPSADDAVALLRRAGLPGFVFPPKKGWVTFFAAEGESQPDERITAASQEILLHFDACEDHGWSFSIFEAAKLVCRFKCDWTRKIRIEDSAYATAALEALIAQQGAASLSAVEAVFRPTSFEQAIQLRPAETFVSAVGLGQEAWLSFDYVAEDCDSYPNVIRVE